MNNAILFIPFIPIVSVILISLMKDKEKIPAISINMTLLIVIFGLIGSSQVISTGQKISSAGNLLSFDKLSSVLIVYVAIISLVILKFSAKYMWDEKGYLRYYVLLNIILSGIYLLIMSSNLIVLAIAWQMMSLGLYFLVSFNVRSRESVKYAGWTILVHRVADLLFILAIVLTYQTFQTFDMSALVLQWQALYESGNVGIEVYTIGFLFLFAALMKSANIPFHIWLPYTSAAPTPVSALMHAGIVNVGGILLNKMAFLLLLTPAVLNVAFIFGLITAIFASILMLVTPDIKRSLGYSTVGQMGYMIMEVGLGAFSLAIYHLMVHGIFKASLFLESGNLINRARHDSNIPKGLSYEVFWEDKSESNSNTFWIIALSMIVPVLIFVGVKTSIMKDFFNFDMAVIILAFAWLTGTQLFFSFFKVSKADSFKVILSLVSSFILIVFTYEFVGLVLEHYLYGDYVEKFFEVASLSSLAIIALSLFITVLLIGWFIIYKQHFSNALVAKEPRKAKWTIYRYLAKEAYFPRFLMRYFKSF